VNIEKVACPDTAAHWNCSLTHLISLFHWVMQIPFCSKLL